MDLLALKNIIGKYDELLSAFDAVSQPRSDYQLLNFVVGDHETPERKYAQVVIELHVKMSVLRKAVVNQRKLIKRIKQEQDIDEKELLIIDLEDLDFSITGAIREFNTLYAIYSDLPKFTAEELQNAETEYWHKRLTRQALIDIEANGRIGTGNLNALRQANMLPEFNSSVEKLRDKFLNVDAIKTLSE